MAVDGTGHSEDQASIYITLKKIEKRKEKRIKSYTKNQILIETQKYTSIYICSKSSQKVLKIDSKRCKYNYIMKNKNNIENNQGFRLEEYSTVKKNTHTS
ncbi:MAG: hypothetical protein HVN35_00305 [Methanobacteriaceae archaeon]|nr:hypothetical protein [Methanobacteriaceae archaeon]